MNKVVAVVLNYNTAKDSKKCLEYLLKQDYADFEIVVVDNNSPMNDYQKLESDIDTLQSNRIELIRNEINSGFSAGNNIGLRRAKEKDAEWSLVINPDVELRDKSYITKMISAISETHKVAVAASNVILPNGQRQNPMIEPKYWEELLWPIESVTRKIRKNNSYLGADQTGYCEKVSGCCFFIRMSFAEKMGYLDESVFLYCEEPILASRVKKYGYKELYVREITAYHMHHDSEKGNQVSAITGEDEGFPCHHALLETNSEQKERTLLLFEDVNIQKLLGVERIKEICAFPIRFSQLEAAPVAIVAITDHI